MLTNRDEKSSKKKPSQTFKLHVTRAMHRFRMAKEKGIFFPAQLPLFKSPPDKKAMEAWVNHQSSPALKRIARKFIDNVDYISFEQFYSQLKLTVDDFNNKVKEPYVLWITQSSTSHSFEAKSEFWMAALAFEHLGLRWPDAIVTTDTLNDYMQSHPGIKNILILDDASHSGTHIQDELHAAGRIAFQSHRTLEDKSHELYIGIPYITSTAKKVITQSSFFKNIHFLSHRPMKSIHEIIDLKDEKELKDVGYISMHRTLTYFDHRFPDFFSTCQNLKTGQNLVLQAIPFMKSIGYDFNDYRHKGNDTDEEVNKKIKTWNDLVDKHVKDSKAAIVPSIIPPYKLSKPDYLKDLKRAIDRSKIGARTPYAVVERMTELKKLMDDAKIPTSGIETVKIDSNSMTKVHSTLFPPKVDEKIILTENKIEDECDDDDEINMSFCRIL